MLLVYNPKHGPSAWTPNQALVWRPYVEQAGAYCEANLNKEEECKSQNQDPKLGVVACAFRTFCLEVPEADCLGWSS